MHKYFVTTALNETAYKENKVYLDVLKVLKIHVASGSVQRSGLLALSVLLEMDAFAATSVGMCGDLTWLLLAVKRHAPELGVVSSGFKCFKWIVT